MKLKSKEKQKCTEERINWRRTGSLTFLADTDDKLAYHQITSITKMLSSTHPVMLLTLLPDIDDKLSRITADNFNYEGDIIHAPCEVPKLMYPSCCQALREIISKINALQLQQLQGRGHSYIAGLKTAIALQFLQISGYICHYKWLLHQNSNQVQQIVHKKDHIRCLKRDSRRKSITCTKTAGALIK